MAIPFKTQVPVAAIRSGAPAWFALVVVAAVLGIAGSAAAHSEVRQQSPAAGQTVGGDVSHIDFVYWTPIREGSVQIEGPSGAILDVETTVSSNNLVLSSEFAPLTEPGPYTVTRTELSVDGDEVTSKFGFIYDPDASDEVLSLIARSSGPNWAILGGLLVVVGLVGFMLWPGRN